MWLCNTHLHGSSGVVGESAHVVSLAAVLLLLLRVHSYGSSIQESTLLLPYTTQLIGEQRVEQFSGVCGSLIWQQIN